MPSSFAPRARLASHHNWILALVIAIPTLVLLMDIFVPLGIALWALYGVAVALALFLPWRRASLIIACACTFLIFVGYFIAPYDLMNYQITVLNRGIGVTAIWVIALVTANAKKLQMEAEYQSWLQSEETALGKALLNVRTGTDLGEELLSFLIPRLGGHLGVVYSIEENSLRHVASYALDREHDSPIPLGQGLAGEAARHGTMQCLSQVPGDYFPISSGLGQAKPSSLLLLPLKHQNTVTGLLEMGTFGQFDRAALQLAERASETAGTAMLAAQFRERLTKALEERSHQAQQLQIQQEELRVINEELEEQTQALQESRSHLQRQQSELEEINAELEQQQQALAERNQMLSASNEELARARSNLAAKASDLEQASRYKSEFLANMSHELRTPLNSMLILAQLLVENREANLSAEQVKFAETIKASGNDLLVLINDVLDLAKVEAGRLEIHPEDLSIKGLAQSLDRAVRPTAEAKGLTFTIKVAENVPETWTSDKVRLEQVLRNFLGNAVKFTEHGSVTLTISTKANRLHFAVSDTGIGVPEDQRQLIFEAFRQASGTDARKYGGTGLGLSISRQLAHLLGGEILIDSKVGEGSTFTLVLPLNNSASSLEPQSREDKPPEIATSVRPAERRPMTIQDDRASLMPGDRSVLVVEDDEAFAGILLQMARDNGFKGLLAGDGIAAVEDAKRFLPSGIILDVRLPELGGLGVLERLKADAATRHIPVHVVSGADYERNALQLGAVGFLRKPTSADALRDAFGRIETIMSQKVKRVLVVEDDKIQRESVCRLISHGNVMTTAVGLGRDALHELKNSTFDCMVLDLRLPDISGFDLLKQLAGDEAISRPPIIVYTAQDLSRDEEEGLRRYSQSIIIKGAKSPERLLDETSLFLHRVESELPMEQQGMLRSLRSRERPLAERRILLVDDDIRNVFALASVLEQRGAGVEVARNGREALTKLDSSENTDLVLMDIMMPEMDGYESMRAIRAQPRFARLPIIALTAKAMKGDQDKCLEAGANDYLAKPIDVDRLLSLVKVWLSTSESFH